MGSYDGGVVRAYGQGCDPAVISFEEDHRDDKWHHYAVSRVGTTVTLNVDGVAIGTMECSLTVGPGNRFFIGSDSSAQTVFAVDQFYVEQTNCGVTLEPTDATLEPTEVTREPTDVTQEPTDVTREPTDVTREPTD